MEFYIPQSLVSDFDDYLQAPICKSIGKIIDWNATTQISENIRAEITKINFKSKISNSDNATICRVSVNTSFKKGDILYDSEKNIYYLCTWNVFEEVNCKVSQLQLCNMQVKIERFVPEVVSNTTGLVTTPASWATIVPLTRGCISRTGYYDLETRAGSVGVVPNNKSVILLQANSASLGLKIKDEFDFHNNRYQVADLEYSELNPDETSGLIIVYAEKKPGG